MGALEQKFWEALCAAIERPDLVAGQFALGEDGRRFASSSNACSHATTFAEWKARLATVDCCVTPIATLDEAMTDPQFASREMVLTRTDGSREYAPPFKVSGHAFTVSRQAPAQGQHSVEILREAGYGAADIDALARPASSGFPDPRTLRGTMQCIDIRSRQFGTMTTIPRNIITDSRPMWIGLHVAAFLSGFLTMALEMLIGQDVHSVFWRNDLYVGGAISIFLSGMTAGYVIGGKAADRSPTPATIAILFIISSALVLAVPLFGEAIINRILDSIEDVRYAALLSALALACLPAATLAAVCPYCVRLLLDRKENSGTSPDGFPGSRPRAASSARSARASSSSR